MKHTNVDTSGTFAVSPTRVPFAEFAGPVRDYGDVLAELLRAAVALVSRFIETVRVRIAINRTIRELQRLDDHVLADIGLSRSQIVPLAYCLGRTNRR